MHATRDEARVGAQDDAGSFYILASCRLSLELLRPAEYESYEIG